MKKVTIFSLVCLLAASGIGLAWEHRGGEGLKIPHGKWWRMPEVTEKLGLTSEEQQKFDDLFVQSRRRMIDLKSNVEKEKLELEMILDQQDFDEFACMDRFKKFEDARTKLANERFGFLVEVRKLLGLDRYRRLKKEFRDRRLHRMKGEREGKGPVKGRMVRERPSPTNN